MAVRFASSMNCDPKGGEEIESFSVPKRQLKTTLSRVLSTGNISRNCVATFGELEMSSKCNCLLYFALSIQVKKYVVEQILLSSSY